MPLKENDLARFRQVAGVLIRYGFGDVLAELELQQFLPARGRWRATEAAKPGSRAQNLRLALQELGAAYVKLGQILSTRSDILTLAYIEELENLQDRVEPFPFSEARRVVESELGRPLESVFARFEQEPFASTSFSQLYRAELVSGPSGASSRRVAVKVLRPGVEAVAQADLAILAEAARSAGRAAIGRRWDLPGLVEQLETALTDELELTREARNARHFRQALAEFPRLRVPEVSAELTTRRILVSDYIEGRPIEEVDPARREPELADELWRAYLKQILDDGVFYSAPHRGNLLLDSGGRIALADHGMVAYFSRETQLRVMALLLALVDRDGERAAEACMEIGTPGAGFRERDFKRGVGLIVAGYSGWIGEPALGRVLIELAGAAFRNNLQIPPEVMLLGKTLSNLEAICRRLDARMDPVSTMREMASSLLGRQIAREFSSHKVLALALGLRSLLSEVPASLRRVLDRASANELRLGVEMEKVDEIQAAIQKLASRVSLGLITAALFVGSALVLNAEAGIKLGGYPLLALVGFLLAAALGLYLVVKVILVDKY